ncbi:4'-phosphopantetheinyl transferase superfamily protein [Neisseria leonii]|uniref:4'-phosphopantetheinyl transferase family protein n=1 Tax=Neisseria leonii TaxID=2995413 RepID=UPI0030CC0F46
MNGANAGGGAEHKGAVCRLAGPDWAVHYDAARLRPQDRARLLRAPQLAGRADWRVSRALLDGADNPVSLSHSCGYAAVLDAPFSGGIDIEYRRPRDFAALLEWVGSEWERDWWRQSRRPAHDFYRLWTVKEALLKAVGGEFPADMPEVGIGTGARGGICLRAPSGRWHGATAEIGICSVSAVWAADGLPPVWRRFGSLAALPCRLTEYRAPQAV